MSRIVALAFLFIGLAQQGFGKQCPAQLKELENGIIDAEIKDLYDPKDRIWYECIPPYVLEDERTKDVTCQDNGRWDYPPPRCVFKVCAGRDPPVNGFQDPDNEEYPIGAPVKYFCNDNFNLDGAPLAVCLPGGIWSDPVPECRAITCPPLEPPVDGTLRPQQRTYPVESIITFKCNTNFDLVGSNQAVCLGSGQWSDEVPECRPRQCERPVDPANGEVVSRNNNQQLFNPGDKVWFKCDNGFRLDGKKDFVCQRDGGWGRDPFPRCVPDRKQCKRPADPANGEVVSRNNNQKLFNPNDKIWFRCDDGFRLDGKKDFVCQSDGGWGRDPFPRCVPEARQCKRPNEPANGFVVPQNNQQFFKPGEKVWFKCDDGFRLDGGAKDFQCQKDGSWKPQPFPRCIRDKPASCPDGSWTDWYDRNSPVGKCDCEILHYLRKMNGVHICEKPTDIQARVVKTKELYKNNLPNVKFSADYGFSCFHTRDHYCQDYEVRFCCPNQARKCRRPREPDNGYIVSREKGQTIFHPDQKIWFKCDDGYTLVGDAKDFVCQKDGSWRPQPFPKCVRPQSTKCSSGNSWTSWFDRDDPSGRCDCETLRDLRSENRGKICERPVGIEARDRHSKHLYTANDQNIHISPTKGFACWNTHSHRCRDYEVRFCCPTGPQTTKCPQGSSWTSWFDRDNPSGRCDCETLGDLRRENRGKICERPAGIEARETHTKRLYTSNYQNIHVSLTKGFACWNTKDHSCKDYEVRFCCPSTVSNPHHQTVVACERDFSKYLRCPRGHKIEIVKAFYGRDDRTTCPSKEIYTDRCYARNSFEKIKESCHHRYSCRLQPSNKVFGDPCVRTYKYIKVTFFCKRH